jgi:hypothetical protein
MLQTKGACPPRADRKRLRRDHIVNRIRIDDFATQEVGAKFDFPQKSYVSESQKMLDLCRSLFALSGLLT